MVKHMSTEILNQVRRDDRVVQDDEWIKAMLQRAPYGMLATALEGQPFVKPSTFVYDEATRSIYLHGAQEGRTVNTLKANPRVCFSVAEMGRLLPGKRAKGFALEYAGVVVFGKAIILGKEEARRGLQLLLDKYAPHLKPGRDYETMSEEELSVTNVYRIEIEQWSGKKREASANVPGAFLFGQTGQ